MYEAQLEFPEGRGGGGGVLEKIPSVGEVWIFSGTTHFGKLKKCHGEKTLNDAQRCFGNCYEIIPIGRDLAKEGPLGKCYFLQEFWEHPL